VYKTSFRVSLLLIVLMLPWAAVQAAGLGKLTLNSALGQPLAAEIEIVTTSSDDVASLKASVATREAFAQAGINYESVLSAVKASVELRSNGNPYIKLTSPQAVNDPFLMILMELSWSSGRTLREYTVLLDPVALIMMLLLPIT
jgi:pilus assembly protein FimV